MSNSQLRLKHLLTTFRDQDNVQLDPNQPRLTLNLNLQNLALWHSQAISIAEKDTNLLLACNSSTGRLEDTTLTWVVGAAIRPASTVNRSSCGHLLISLGLEADLVESILTHCPGIGEDIIWALYYNRNKKLCVSPVINAPQERSDDSIQSTGQGEDTRFQQMTANAHILGLGYDQSLPRSIRAILQRADASKRLLTNTEIEVICSLTNVNPIHLRKLQLRAPFIVDAAKDCLLQKEPSLFETGGALHPKSRADACWRDCWHFLRMVFYAVATNRPSFTHPLGVEGLSELYTFLGVPTSSIVSAVSLMKLEAHIFYSSFANKQDILILDQSLQHLEQAIHYLAPDSSASRKALS